MPMCLTHGMGAFFTYYSFRPAVVRSFVKRNPKELSAPG